MKKLKTYKPTDTFFPVKEMEAVKLNWDYVDKTGKNDLSNTGYKFIVREDTNEVLSCMTNDYKLVENKEIFNIASPIVKEKGGLLTEVKNFGNGARTKYKFTFPDIKVKITKKDVLHPHIDMWNSYDGTHQVNLLSGCFRLICSNGLVIGHMISNYNFRHLIGNDNLTPDNFAQAVQKSIDKTIEIFDKDFPKLIETTAKSSDKAKFIKMLPEYVSDDVVAKLLSGQKMNTYWDLINVATYLATHIMNRNWESTHKWETKVYPTVKSWALKAQS